MCLEIFVVYIELYLVNTYTWRRVYIYALSHHTSDSKIESNRQFLLKNRLSIEKLES